MNKPITAKTIAEIVGVSVGTVDRALNSRGRINSETKQKILETCKKFNYKPNKIARALGRQKEIRIAAVFPEKPNYFFDNMKYGFIDAQNDLSDYGIRVDFIHTESLDPVSQEKTLQEMAADKYDGILINAGGTLINKYIDSFMQQGIPVVTFNSDTPTSNRLFYVGHNDKSSGGIAAELMGKFLGGKGNVLILTGFRNVQSHANRVVGFDQVLQAEYPDIKIVDLIEYHDKEESVFQKAASALKKHRSVDGIFVTSAPGAIGAGHAVLDSKPQKNPIIIGYDVNKHVSDLLKKCICSAIIYQDPYAQSYYALKYLSKHILDNWQPGSTQIFIRSKIILKQNVDEYIFQQGKDQEALYDTFI